jgi:hypothetical protein
MNTLINIMLEVIKDSIMRRRYPVSRKKGTKTWLVHRREGLGNINNPNSQPAGLRGAITGGDGAAIARETRACPVQIY